MSTHGTVLHYSPRHRLAVIGWESGDVQSMVLSEHLTDREVGLLLAMYDEPIPVKYGTHVRTLVPQTSEPTGETISALFETIPLRQVAYLTATGDRITFWCGMSSATGRWYVRM